MTFPHYFHIFGLRVHPHPVMEVLGYTAGFQLYLLLRRRWPGIQAPFEQGLWLIVGAIFGALFGSKLLAWIESWPDYWQLWQANHDLSAFFGGKTIVGGLLGGWLGEHWGLRVALGFAGSSALLLAGVAWRRPVIRSIKTLPTLKAEAVTPYSAD